MSGRLNNAFDSGKNAKTVLGRKLRSGRYVGIELQGGINHWFGSEFGFCCHLSVISWFTTTLPLLVGLGLKTQSLQIAKHRKSKKIVAVPMLCRSFYQDMIVLYKFFLLVGKKRVRNCGQRNESRRQRSSGQQSRRCGELSTSWRCTAAGGSCIQGYFCQFQQESTTSGPSTQTNTTLGSGTAIIRRHMRSEQW